MRRFLLLLLAGGLAVPPALRSGDITGTVMISGDVSDQPAASIRGIYRGAPAVQDQQQHPPDIPKAVVYIDGLKTPDIQPDPPRQTINQENLQFRPDLLPVLVGTIVDFPNNDHVYHNAFSYSKAKRFDLGRYEKGKSKSVLLDKPGVVRVFCEIHTHMRAVILVLENPYFTVAENGQPYRIKSVPPGDYRLTVWHERLDSQSRQITVPATGTITADFTL
jgi:hypothetical protein